MVLTATELDKILEARSNAMTHVLDILRSPSMDDIADLQEILKSLDKIGDVLYSNLLNKGES